MRCHCHEGIKSAANTRDYKLPVDLDWCDVKTSLDAALLGLIDATHVLAGFDPDGLVWQQFGVIRFPVFRGAAVDQPRTMLDQQSLVRSGLRFKNQSVHHPVAAVV